MGRGQGQESASAGLLYGTRGARQIGNTLLSQMPTDEDRALVDNLVELAVEGDLQPACDLLMEYPTHATVAPLLAELTDHVAYAIAAREGDRLNFTKASLAGFEREVPLQAKMARQLIIDRLASGQPLQGDHLGDFNRNQPLDINPEILVTPDPGPVALHYAHGVVADGLSNIDMMRQAAKLLAGGLDYIDESPALDMIRTGLVNHMAQTVRMARASANHKLKIDDRDEPALLRALGFEAPESEHYVRNVSQSPRLRVMHRRDPDNPQRTLCGQIGGPKRWKPVPRGAHAIKDRYNELQWGQPDGICSRCTDISSRQPVDEAPEFPLLDDDDYAWVKRRTGELLAETLRANPDTDPLHLLTDGPYEQAEHERAIELALQRIPAEDTEQWARRIAGDRADRLPEMERWPVYGEPYWRNLLTAMRPYAPAEHPPCKPIDVFPWMLGDLETERAVMAGELDDDELS